MKSILFCFVSLFLFSFPNQETQVYQLDPTHTFINFKVERFMVGEVSGRFNEFKGEIHYNPDDLSSFKADVTIQTKTIDTGMEVRDGHLRGKIWLDVETYPEIRFASKKLEQKEDQLMLTADLTIHGVTKEVVFPIEILGPFKDPTQTTSLGLKGGLTINRQDYGIAFSRLMDNGKLFIGNEVRIDIQALAVVPKS